MHTEDFFLRFRYLYKPEINQFGAASTKGGSCKLNSNNCAGQFLPCKRGSATASEHVCYAKIFHCSF